MSKFFIHRPIFAWVIALFVIIAGIVSITQLPVSQYPRVAPPTIRVVAAYPGATAATIDATVLSLIEREMNGAEGLMYMQSQSTSNGSGSLTLTFTPETDPDMAQVEVQNRLKAAESRLPSTVKQLGVRVNKATSNFLLIVSFNTTSDRLTIHDVADYVNRNVLPELQRTEGVGAAQLYASGRAMRVWVDPVKLEGLGMSVAEVSAAISSQNMQIAGGSLGAAPSVEGQAISAAILVPGQMQTAEEFGNIIVRHRDDGATVRLRDVARVELGIENYNFGSRLNGQPSVAVAVQLNSTGNALATAETIRSKMEVMAKFMPEGMIWDIPYDTSTFVSISIEKVVHTLLEAIALVFIVMFIFLQNIRYTLIPTLVVPVALLGTFAALHAMGMSVNILAMFAMVLVIGIVVDDAIVVVENVERIMAEEGLSPLNATIKAMSQIQGAVVGITVILVSVFLPLAFFSGAVGNIYRQFSLVMAISIAFSGFFALTLTPALCATLLKPIEQGHNHMRKTGLLGGLFNGFNRGFGKTAKKYESVMVKVVRRSWQVMVVYLAIVAGVWLLFARLPTGFLPAEDQGVVLISIQLPGGASMERTSAVVAEVEEYMRAQPEVENFVSIIGFNFSGQGQNVALAFATLKDWSERKADGSDAQSLAGRATGALGSIRDGFAFAITLPSIPELGTSNGFSMRLQDRAGKGHEALVQARNQLLGLARQSKVLTRMRFDGLDDAPQWRIQIDRNAAYAQGVSLANIASTLGGTLGSSNVSDFVNQGYVQWVTVQAEPGRRMQPEDVMKLTVPNDKGQLVPLSTFATAEWTTGPVQVTRYNGYPAMPIAGDAAPGYSSGQAMAEMARLAAELPEGFGFEWTGQSLDEIKAGSQSLILYAFSILAVFLCLAALYESWSIPLSVLLVVPLGVLGVLFGVNWRGLDNDIYFQVGLITVIGLSAKNAILIVEFAKDLQAEGRSVVKAALMAAHLRFRPILMTSLAFILGVVPLYFASGASAASQRAIGTSVLWGMLVGTILAVFMVPVFFVVVRNLFTKKRDTQRDNDNDDDEGSVQGPSEVVIP